MFYSKPWLDALIVLLVVVLIFGPKRLPQLGKSLGHGMREFKDGITGNSRAEAEDEEKRPELTQATAAPTPGSEQTPAEAQPAPDISSAERRS